MPPRPPTSRPGFALRSPFPSQRSIPSVALALLFGISGNSQAFAQAFPAQTGGRGKVVCRVSENGAAASGTISLRLQGKEVASGACGAAVSVPVGSYDAVLRLDGALDRPEQSKPIVVRAGDPASVSGDFATGELAIEVSVEGKPAAGMANIVKAGRKVGTLGAGVSAHLSAGTYDVVVFYRSKEKTFSAVRVGAGEHRVLSATF